VPPEFSLIHAIAYGLPLRLGNLGDAHPERPHGDPVDGRLARAHRGTHVETAAGDLDEPHADAVAAELQGSGSSRKRTALRRRLLGDRRQAARFIPEGR